MEEEWANTDLSVTPLTKAGEEIKFSIITMAERQEELSAMTK